MLPWSCSYFKAKYLLKLILCCICASHCFVICSDNDPTELTDLVVGSFIMGPQMPVKGRTTLDNHPLHHSQTSPPVLLSCSSSKAEAALGIIPEENLELHEVDQQQPELQTQETQQQQNIHGQVEEDNSLSVEANVPSTLQVTSNPPINSNPINESSNLSVSNKSNVTYSSQRSTQPSVNPQSSNVPVGTVRM